MIRVKSCTHYGLEAYEVTVEVDRSRGLPQLITVGLPDASVKESRERVKTALKNCGFDIPPQKLTVNLAPADRKKEGSAFDLPIALGILAAYELISPEKLSDYFFIGELALDGKLRAVQGTIILTSSFPQKKFIVPKEKSESLLLHPSATVYPAESLRDVIDFLEETLLLAPLDVKIKKEAPGSHVPDFSDVQGALSARRAIEIAASGNHNLLMVGPPGGGKTMLAKRILGILPPLSSSEALEVLQIQALCGLDNDWSIGRRPFRAPHHSASGVALTGGGVQPRPGEISLAHHGVLFLDELAEFNRSALESLRAPLEDGFVTISRANGRLSLPSKFLLVAAMNPCPCGYLSDPRKPCRCSLSQIQKYRNKISGPIFDRIDMHVEVPPLSYQSLSGPKEAESSTEIRKRVLRARRIQKERFKSQACETNHHMGPNEIKHFSSPDSEGKKLLEAAMKNLHLSARAYYKILKVARTIADLGKSEAVLAVHIAEAISYRTLDRERWI